MNFIHKRVILLVLLMSLSSAVFSATESTLNQQRESILYATLVAMSFDNATPVVTDNEVVVDYVIRPLQSDVDLVLQLQAIFIAAAKVAPETVLTVIKGRYDANHPPMLVLAVPNNVTQKLIAEVIDPMAFWQLVAINEETLLDATKRQERKGLRISPQAQRYPVLTWRNQFFGITQEELVISIGTITGLGETAIKQLNGKQPARLKPLQDTLLAVKIADILYQAKDTEELATLLPWLTAKKMAWLIESVYPETIEPWFDAITRYKVSFNLLPQETTLNPLAGTLVSSYNDKRKSGASPQQVYQEVLDTKEAASERKKIHNELVSFRKLSEGQLAEKLDMYLLAKADALLRNRLEAEYQRQMFRTIHHSLTDYLWDQKSIELEAIRALF